MSIGESKNPADWLKNFAYRNKSGNSLEEVPDSSA